MRGRTEERRACFKVESLGYHSNEGLIVRVVDPLLVQFDVLPVDSPDERSWVFHAGSLAIVRERLTESYSAEVENQNRKIGCTPTQYERR